MGKSLEALELIEARDPEEVSEADQAASVNCKQVLVVFLQFFVDGDDDVVVNGHKCQQESVAED